MYDATKKSDQTCSEYTLLLWPDKVCRHVSDSGSQIFTM